MSAKSPPQANPYIVGPPVEGATLYGREDVFSFVYETLTSERQNAVVLHGQRRAGKTSILRELPNRLPEAQFHTTYFDLQGQARLELAEVLRNLAVAIARPLELSLPAGEGVKNSKDYFQKEFLPKVWQKLGERRLLLLFDEFESPSESEDRTIREKAEQEFYPYMRELLDTEKQRLVFVFVVGRRIEDLTQWVKRVFKEAQSKKIGLLQKAEAIELIRKPAENRLVYEPEAIESILDLTAGHPFFTQLICFELFSYAQKRQSKSISAHDVAAVVGPALESGKPQFSWLWDAISPSGKIYLSAVAQIRAERKKANGDAIQEILNRFRIRPGPNWNSVPRELAEWDVLRDDPADIQFVVRLVELWVRQSYTLRDIKAMLMHQGENDFEAARALAQQGQLDQAIKALRDLLTTNPNHLGAQLTLAQTLLEQKKLKEAVDAFEDAFWMDAAVGREGLVDARLALAQSLDEKNQFIESAIHYRRVLELKPGEYRVQEKLRVLYDQGRKAYAAGDWANAAHLLERVTHIDKNYRDAHDRRNYAYDQLKAAAQAGAGQAIPPETTMPAPSPARSSVASIIGAVAIVLVVLGGVGWLFWSGGFAQATPTPTPQAVAISDDTPTLEPTLEPTAELTQEPTTTPTEESTPEPSPEPTAEPTQEPAIEPTVTPTEEPTQEPTPTPTSTPIEPPTPIIIVVTSTATPTPPLPSYPQPQLISPPNLDLNSATGIFTGKFPQPRLEWEPVPGLGENDFYVVTVSFPVAGGTAFEGASVKTNFWDVDLRFYDQVAGPQRDFRWSVVVSHYEGSRINAQGIVEPVGQGIEVSPRSEERVFRWN